MAPAKLPNKKVGRRVKHQFQEICLGADKLKKKIAADHPKGIVLLLDVGPYFFKFKGVELFQELHRFFMSPNGLLQ